MISSRISIKAILAVFFGTLVSATSGMASGVLGPDEVVYIVQDTIPIKDNPYGNFTTDEYNPFDIKPSIIEQKVEYDFESGRYVVFEKIGDEYYRTPTYLTLSEYLDWQAKKQEQDHFRKLSGIKSKDFTAGLQLDPMSEIDVEALLIDRLFGGTDIEIKPTGNIDLTLGFFFQDIDNPNLNQQTQTQFGFPDFDMEIDVGVEGQIGDKLNLGFNYNTQATFGFDNKLNLGYGSELFDEDDIIKNIEAGDVNFTLPGELIQGQQNLFGLKTELQFGKFFLTAVASQSRSERESITLENGKLIQDFELLPDQYDENRHFFIAHYFRENFENALRNIPQVRSLVRISDIEVWVTNDQRNDLTNATSVTAIEYLGESNLNNFSDPDTRWVPTFTATNHEDVDGQRLPSNLNSDLFNALVNDDDTRQIDNVETNLQAQFGLTKLRDFERHNMRKLNPNEYTFHAELGYISLNQRLRPNQVLGVAFEYTYSINGNQVYKVGELTNESNRGGLNFNQNDEVEIEPEDVIYVKMLKSSNQNPDMPSWDLMMKNIYPLSTSSLTEEDFRLDIFFEDNTNNTQIRFIPEPGFRDVPLLTLFQLDRLNIYGDPQEDGIFDFVPGISVNTRTGSIIFPVLEPFGESLRDFLVTDELFERYAYPELYRNTVTTARQNPERNRFIIKGQVKSNTSSEISLGAFNIPQGSVTVRAGSQILREGIDYDIDYGIGRIKILNESFLQQGVPINVSFEDQGLFNLQQKTMFGLRGEFRFNPNFTLGATYMRLFERPFTQKVNIGEDPINNRMFGLDLNYSTEAPGITTFLDRLPLLQTDAPSSVTFSAEVAGLKPGNSGAINAPDSDQGVVSLDDFEGANSGIPLGSRTNIWSLASPSPIVGIEDGEFIDDVFSGANRALINWYVVDDLSGVLFNETTRRNSYTRRIDQTELFDRDIDVSQIPDLRTFDITYYPDQRGPYNYDVPDGLEGGISDSGLPIRTAGVSYDETTDQVILNDPESRWGGIMRYLPNNDFEAANYEYIEFWMLNPFMDTDDVQQPAFENGNIFFHLGNVSEDVLRDNLQFYENSIPTDDDVTPIRETNWGDVPLSIPNVQGFEIQFQEQQDLGLDGLTDEQERARHEEYVTTIESAFPTRLTDVANDNYLAYLDDSFSDDVSLLERYRLFNHPQGNAPTRDARIGLGNPVPDAEDLNSNRSLETNESYFEYAVPIVNSGGEIDVNAAQFVTDSRSTMNPETGEEEIWYRFQIPIASPTATQGDLSSLRSIQFMRIVMAGFEQQKTFRLADFELVRNQWRRLVPECDEGPDDGVDFIVNEVGIQENGRREPFRYVLPRGIQQERIFSTFSNILQDENSLALNVIGLTDSCEMMMTRLTRLDMRQFDDLEMFVHAEERGQPLEDGDLSVFIRIGKDFLNNYYEYEVPLVFSDSTITDPLIDGNGDFIDFDAYQAEVWKEDNMISFPLRLFQDAKIARNASTTSVLDEFTVEGANPDQPNARITVKGSPTLGLIKSMVIGVRNTGQAELEDITAEVWVNELRLKGLNNRGGVAAIARADVQLADLGNVTASYNYSSIGFGQIDQQVQDRSLESVEEYDFAANLQLGKLFPQNWGLSVPFYYQFARSTSTPEFDPLELDLTKDELLTNPNLTENEREDINDRQKDITTIRTFNFTNVRKEKTSQGKPKPWDISNLSASYSFSRITHSDEIIRNETTDDQRGELAYTYNAQSKPIQPFKKIKPKALRLIKEFNFNPIPNSVSFNTQLNRFKSSRLFRLPDPAEGFEYVFDDQRFTWDRNYSLNWDLSKSLKLNYNATASAVVDELKQVGVAPNAADRRWNDVFGNEFETDENGDPIGESFESQIANDPGFVSRYLRDNLRDFGRLKFYNQGIALSYRVPFRYIPGLDWIDAQAQYNGDYTWNAASLTSFDDNGETLGNIIQNSQRRTVRATLDFEELYEKIPYFKRLEGKNRRNTRRRSSRDAEEKPEKNTGEASTLEKILLRPLLSIREVKLNYVEELSTTIPGYLNTPRFFGLTGNDPGLGFTLGAQPNLTRFLDERGERIITTSIFQNQQIIQENRQTYEADLTIEPWKGFEIDVDFRKRYTQNHSEYFVNAPVLGSIGDTTFQRLTQRDFGSFEISYIALNTLFNSDVDELFARFDANRRIISNRLPNADGAGSHLTDVGFAEGFGRQQVEVLIPAFISAYTNEDPNTTDLDFRSRVERRGFIPNPNWSLTYNGLSDLPFLKEVFSNISVRHSYQTSLTVNSFETDLQFDAGNPFFVDPNISTGNYFARFEVPEIVIDERFQPIIGLDLRTNSDLSINADYSKSRSLRLATTLAQLTEAKTTSFTVGLGWTFQDVKIGFLLGKNRNRERRRNQDPDNPENEELALPSDDNRRGINSGGVTEEQANRLEFTFDLQFRDDVTFIHELGDGQTAEPTRGTKTLTFAPVLNYDVNKNFILSVFFDYSATRPFTSTQFPITNINGGITARFVLD